MISKENFVDFFFLLGFSYTNTDDSHDSRVERETIVSQFRKCSIDRNRIRPNKVDMYMTWF